MNAPRTPTSPPHPISGLELVVSPRSHTLPRQNSAGAQQYNPATMLESFIQRQPQFWTDLDPIVRLIRFTDERTYDMLKEKESKLQGLFVKLEESQAKQREMEALLEGERRKFNTCSSQIMSTAQSLQQALNEKDTLATKNEELMADLNSQSQALKELRLEFSKRSKENKSLREKLDETCNLKNKVDEYDRKLREAEKSAREMKLEMVAATEGRASAERQLDSAKNKIKTHETLLAERQRLIEESAREIESLKSEVATAKRNTSDSQHRLKARERDIADLSTTLESSDAEKKNMLEKLTILQTKAHFLVLHKRELKRKFMTVCNELSAYDLVAEQMATTFKKIKVLVESEVGEGNDGNKTDTEIDGAETTESSTHESGVLQK